MAQLQDTRFNATATIRTPWGYADVQSPIYEAISSLSIKNSTTIVNYETLTGDMTVNIDAIPQSPDQLNKVVLVLTADASPRTVTTGNMIVPAADATVVAAGTTVQITLEYVNSAYTIISKVVI